MRAYTQSAATIEARPGGKFSWFNGSVLGEFVELDRDRKIEMKWRFSTWKEGTYSKVEAAWQAYPIQDGDNLFLLLLACRWSSPLIRLRLELRS